MKREGWANAVGQVYLTRDGREVMIQHYSVAVFGGLIEADLVGVLQQLEPEPSVEPNVIAVLHMLDYDENGNVSATFDPDPPIVYVGAVRQPHPLDLVGAKLPAGAVRAELAVEDDAKGESDAEQSI